MAVRRKDNKGRVLKEGESQRKDGSYDYRWRTIQGKRHSVYAKTLEELREKEQEIQRDKNDGIRTEAKNTTLNDIFDLWIKLKKGLKDNSFQNYQYMYHMFVYPDFGMRKVMQIKKSDVRRFYNMLSDERQLKTATIDNIHTVLHQVLDLAVEDNYLRNNPSDNALKELKQAHNMDSEKKRALTYDEQQVFIEFLKNSRLYNHWLPIFSVMLETGLRVGEIIGLRWEDVDFDKKTISINHTVVYYNHAKNGCYYNIHTPKTKAGIRTIPMTENVIVLLQKEKEYQKLLEITCQMTIDGYTDFIFLNRYGKVHNQATLNKALRRIMRDCNQEMLAKAGSQKDITLLPRFSCHILRHTFTTRLCEAGVNVKVIQDMLGHADISTTLNIYADATKDLKEWEMKGFCEYMRNGKIIQKPEDNTV